MTDEQKTPPQDTQNDSGGDISTFDSGSTAKEVQETANKEVTQEMHYIQEAAEEVEAALNDISNNTRRAINEIAAMATNSLLAFSSVTDAVSEFINAASFTMTANALQAATFKSLTSALQNAIENSEELQQRIKEHEALKPLLEKELKKPQYNNKSIDELINESKDENGEIIDGSLWQQALNAARTALAEQETERATVKRADSVDYPLDKINSEIWNLFKEDTQGQLSLVVIGNASLPLDVTSTKDKRKHKDPVTVIYSVNFDELDGNGIKITKRLTPFDKRVYYAVSALFNAGNNVITLTQIHYAMGNEGKPSNVQVQKIYNAVSKMTGARISVDNTQEADSYKYPRFVYEGSLLPMERGAVIVNGQLADAAIHIFREPPLITFARKRMQITTVELKLLQSPVSKTDANLQIDDYLIERIAKAKNGKGKSCRILYKTLYERTSITTKKQRARAQEKIKRYLDHYKQCGFITGYSMKADGLTVHY